MYAGRYTREKRSITHNDLIFNGVRVRILCTFLDDFNLTFKFGPVLHLKIQKMLLIPPIINIFVEISISSKCNTS